MMARSRRLLLETLEDRCVPATFGNPWPDATHITLSFVPDGTNIGGQRSDLFQALNSLEPTAAWQRDILRAFQTWASTANINVGVVSDDGEPLGTPGRPQSDPRFGDIRISAGKFSSEVAAFSAPFDVTAGTNSGDVRLNSSVLSHPGYDLYTVVLHEAGLVYGLPENLDTSSIMDTYYLGPRTGLGTSDIANIQALYGLRKPDVYEGATGNNSMATAYRLQLLANSNGVLSLGLNADLGSTTQQDWYSFQAPTLTGGLVINLQRAGVSLLTPRVTVYNSDGQVVGTAVSTDPLGSDLTIQVNGVVPLANYYVEVQGASGTAFDVGSYGLQIYSLPLLNGLTSFLTGTLGTATQSVVELLPLNSTFATAWTTDPLLAGPANQVDYSFRGTLLLSGQAGYFLVQAPAASTGDNVMTVMSWASAGSQLLPQVTVYNAQQQVVPSQVLVNEGGAVAVQVTGVTPGASYYVKVSGTGSGASSVGGYFVGVNYIAHAEQLTTIANSQLTPRTPTQQGQFNVPRTGVFHFVLAASAGSGTGVLMTITNSHGTVVGQVLAQDGQAASLTLTLAAGTYTIQVTAYRGDGQPITAVNFLLEMELLSNPVGPQPSDPTTDSSSGSSSSSSSSTSSTDNSGPPPSSSYYTYNWSGNSGTYGGPGTSDPSSSGYTV
jgi:hypothetical protein